MLELIRVRLPLDNLDHPGRPAPQDDHDGSVASEYQREAARWRHRACNLDLMADGARRLVALGVEKDGVIAVH